MNLKKKTQNNIQLLKINLEMLNTKKKKRKEKKLEITKIKKKLFIRIIKI